MKIVYLIQVVAFTALQLAGMVLLESLHWVGRCLAAVIGIVRSYSPTFLWSHLVVVDTGSHAPAKPLSNNGSFSSQDGGVPRSRTPSTSSTRDQTPIVAIGYLCTSILRPIEFLLSFLTPKRVGAVVKFEGIPFADTPTRFSSPQPITDEILKNRECPLIPDPASRTAFRPLRVSNPCRVWRTGYPIGSAATFAPQVHDNASMDSPMVWHGLSALHSVLRRSSVMGIESECLQVNVWTPASALDGTKKQPLRPVFVFIHGGGFFFGSSHQRQYSGEAMCRKHGFVTVSFNYRLGLIGFMHVPGCPENRGLLDQVEALRWVQRNITKFGGDPTNVTVSGQSAGGMSVSALIGMPVVYEEKLFHKAVLFSGGPTHFWTMDEARGNFKNAKAHVSGKSETNERGRNEDDSFVAHLSTMPLTELIGLQARMSASHRKRFVAGEISRLMCWVPVVAKGSCMPEPPVGYQRTMVASGQIIPVMAGSTDDEFTLFTRPYLGLVHFGYFEDHRLTEQITNLIRSQFEGFATKAEVADIAKRVASAYSVKTSDRSARLTKPNREGNAMIADYIFRMPVELAADAAGGAAFLYRFDRRCYLPQIGATHIMDLAYWLGTTDVYPYFAGPVSGNWWLKSTRGAVRVAGAGDDQKLATAMNRRLAAFAVVHPNVYGSCRTNAPAIAKAIANSSDVLRDWIPSGGPSGRQVLVFGLKNDPSRIEMLHDPDGEETRAWGGVFERSITVNREGNE